MIFFVFAYFQKKTAGKAAAAPAAPTEKAGKAGGKGGKKGKTNHNDAIHNILRISLQIIDFLTFRFPFLPAIGGKK